LDCGLNNLVDGGGNAAPLLVKFTHRLSNSARFSAYPVAFEFSCDELHRFLAFSQDRQTFSLKMAAHSGD